MSQPIVYVNGKWTSPDSAVVPINDTGFLLGVTVAERLRSFGGKLFRLDDHLKRLEQSLKIVGIKPPEKISELRSAAKEIVSHNHGLIAAENDLGLALFVTPGALSNASSDRPMVCIHTEPLPFEGWANLYKSGQNLRSVSVRQVPSDCWPPELKCRSRMHYYLADREAREVEPSSRAIIMNHDEHVLEATTANILVYTEEKGILSPPIEKILPGVSVAMVETLAKKLGVPFQHRDITISDLTTADEVFLTSTSPCILPVGTIDGESLKSETPGPMFGRLMKAWGKSVGIDIIGQAQKFAKRSS